MSRARRGRPTACGGTPRPRRRPARARRAGSGRARAPSSAGRPPPRRLVASQRAFLEGRRPGDPFRGYYFRVLTGQGPHAPGGAMSYFVGDRMVRGFAMIAWPAVYRGTGVMTFIVNHSGRVLQKDLGEDTGSLVQTLAVYDPGEGWAPVRP